MSVQCVTVRCCDIYRLCQLSRSKLCLKFALHTQSPYLRFNNPFRVRNTPRVLKYPFLCNKQQHHSLYNLIGLRRSRCFLLLGESLGNDDASSSGSITLALCFLVSSHSLSPWVYGQPIDWMSNYLMFDLKVGLTFLL